MCRPTIILATLLLAGFIPGQSPDAVKGGTYEFTNGRWFDGRGFTPGRFYSSGGILSSRRPARVDTVIDLKGRYVVPPFGEAHNHNVEHSPRIDDVIRRYLRDGVFYVKNPNSLPRTTRPLTGKVNIPGSIDVAFAMGGLTASGGHPIGVVERNIGRGTHTRADGEGAFYFTIDDLAGLDRKWEAIRAGKPDFIKTYLLYSEEYAKRKDDPAYFAQRGLDPALLPEIVRRAHRAGLRVSTHIESAADFRHAVAAGVDEINHMPGFRGDPRLEDSRYEITEEDARLATERGIVVVTTLGAIRELRGPLRQRGDALYSRNLRLLQRHQVRIAIGSDDYEQTSLPEALYLHGLKVFDNLTLLKMWCETTAEAIFPGRRVGRLQDGYEASFLVLGGDPIQDFAHVQRIELRVKQGEVLPIRP